MAMMRGMNKRIAAAVLWFLTGWYAGGYVSLILGVPELIGPILGIACAALFAGDPLDVIWTTRAAAVAAPEARSEIEEPVELAEAA